MFVPIHLYFVISDLLVHIYHLLLSKYRYIFCPVWLLSHVHDTHLLVTQYNHNVYAWP